MNRTEKDRNSDSMEELEEMYEQEITLLSSKKPINSDQGTLIDRHIITGMKRAKQEQKHHNRSKMYKRLFAISCVAAILLLFITSIRASPAFASYVRSIPGFEKFVQLIETDKGLISAVDHDFFKNVGASDTHHDITFTVEKVIADENRLNIFYAIQTNGNEEYIHLEKLEIKDEQGEGLAASMSYGHYANMSLQEENYQEGKLDLTFLEGTNLPEQVSMQVTLSESDQPGYQGKQPLEGLWNVTFPLEKERFLGMKQEYELNETVEIEGQKIRFKRLIMYPTTAVVDIEYDDQNSKQIFSFDDLRITDDLGEEWGTPSNGLVSTGTKSGGIRMYFQSNYFEEPEHVYLQFSSVTALEKEKAKIVVDIEKKELIYRPDDRLELKSISYGKGVGGSFTLAIQTTSTEKDGSLSFGNTFSDASGREFEFDSTRTTYMEGNEYGTTLQLTKEAFTSPITIPINRYPTRIYQDIKIQVK